MRPEHNGLAGECRLEQVVAAGGNKAAADKDDVRQLEDSRQLADCVEQENLRRIELRRKSLVGGFESRTTNEAQPRAREQLSDRFKTGRMARGEDQQRPWMRTADLFPRFQDQRLFVRHRTRRHHDRTASRCCQGLPQNARQPADLGRASVEFQVSGHHHTTSRDAQKPKSLGIALGLGANAVDVFEHAAHERAEQSIASERPVGEARIHQHDSGPELVGGAQEIGPQLSFDNNERGRPDSSDHSPGGARPIQRHVEAAGHSRRGAGGCGRVRSTWVVTVPAAATPSAITDRRYRRRSRQPAFTRRAARRSHVAHENLAIRVTPLKLSDQSGDRQRLTH